MSAPVIIIGAGGHAAVVADALLACDVQVIGFTDTDSGRDGATIFGLPVLGDDSVLDHYDRRAVVLANGIGGSGSRACGHCGRRAAQVRLAHNGWQFTTVVHPGAVVSPRAQVAIGVQVFASAVIQARACIKEGCIVNTGAVAEHDVVLGEYSHPRRALWFAGRDNRGGQSHWSGCGRETGVERRQRHRSRCRSGRRQGFRRRWRSGGRACTIVEAGTMRNWQEALVGPETSLREALQRIDRVGCQIVLVVDQNGRLVGTLSDGDARRGMLRGLTLADDVAAAMHTSPTSARQDDDRQSILATMRRLGLHQVPLLDAEGVVVGLAVIDDYLAAAVREHWVVVMAGGWVAG